LSIEGKIKIRAFMHIALEIPDNIAGVIPPDQDPARAALEALALEGYRTGRLSEAAIRRLLGFETRTDVHGFLKEHGVYMRATLEDIERDTRTALESAQRTRAENDASPERAG
jgi:hypothetical protein